MSSFSLRIATPDDATTLLMLVRGLAEYERAPGDVVATEGDYVRAPSSFRRPRWRR
nr:hypothetical protein [Deltaproteobacteria bacterium]